MQPLCRSLNDSGDSMRVTLTKVTRVAFTIASLLFASWLHAQTTTTLVGGVTDPSGGGIANAQVIATNSGTHFSRSAQTNAEREYRFDFLPIGNYTVEFSASGFKKSIRNDIELTVNVTTRVDSRLEVGAIS